MLYPLNLAFYALLLLLDSQNGGALLLLTAILKPGWNVGYKCFK